MDNVFFLPSRLCPRRARVQPRRAGGDVVQREAPLPQVALGELLLDALLAGEEPVQGLVEFVDLGVLYLQFLRECGVAPAPRACQLAGPAREIGDGSFTYLPALSPSLA
jgi:hypothetical protein